MDKIDFEKIEGMKFPSGRQTKVIVGANSPIQAENFVLGIVELEPNGKVPLHSHEQEEVYVILEGKGKIRVGEEVSPVRSGIAVYLPPHTEHELINDSDQPMKMMFTYAPAGVVSHWEEEKKGLLK